MRTFFNVSRYFVSMCTLAFQIQPLSEWPLILIGNRDEFFQRPTKAMHWWTDAPILAGKDLQSGGTWGAVAPSGRFAMLTNFRHPKYLDRQGPTRGELVVKAVQNKDFSVSNEGSAGYWDRYNGFNLLWGDHREVYVYSNVDHQLHTLNQGTHGLSNAFLNTDWPKVRSLRTWLADRTQKMVTDPYTFMEDAFDILSDETTFPDHLLPSTGVPLEMEKALSALRVRMNGYGSRVSTVYMRHQNGTWVVGERNFDNGAIRTFRFHEV